VELNDAIAHAQRVCARAAELQSLAARTVADAARLRAQRFGDAPTREVELRKEVEGLRASIASRAVIEQAKGIVIAATGCTADEAFALLVQQSQHENRKLREIAADLVESKSRPGVRLVSTAPR
jgi:AmiR/NasT family two-component response regulator